MCGLDWPLAGRRAPGSEVRNMAGHAGAYTRAVTLARLPMPRLTRHLLPLRRLHPTLMALALLCGPGPFSATAGEHGAVDDAGVIVKFRSARLTSALSVTTARPDAAPRRAQALGQRTGLRLSDGIAVSSDTQVIHAQGQSTAALMKALAADPQVEYVVENRRRRAHAAVNDPLLVGGAGVSPEAGQWYLGAPNAVLVSAVNAEAAWAVTTGRADVVVAVLDSGVRFKHPDLDGKLLPGHDFISKSVTASDGDGRDGNPSDQGDWITADEDANSPVFRGCGVADSGWHGTQMAGLVGAATNNATGMAGIGRHVRILPVRVLGKCGGYDADIVAGMRWAGGLHVEGVPDNPTPARVINLSLGSTGDCAADEGRAYREAVAELRQAGVTIVASAGNDNGAVSMPANCAGVIAVSSLRHAGDKSDFSSLGTEVAIAAPGGNCVNATGKCLYPILSTSNTGRTGPECSTYTNGGATAGHGTSFSAPMVAGTIALMLSAQPTLTPDRIKALLQSTARAFPVPTSEDLTPMCSASTLKKQVNCHCTTTTCGAGMLDAGAAVRAAAAAGPAVVARLEDAQTRVPLNTSTVLNASGSGTVAGRTITGYQWRLTDGSTLARFTGSTTASTATLSAIDSGLVTVELSVTDSTGAVGRSSTVLRTGEAPAAVCGPDETDEVAVEGGGALGGGWLAGLAAVVALLVGSRRRAATRA
jgi:serine protease